MANLARPKEIILGKGFLPKDNSDLGTVFEVLETGSFASRDALCSFLKDFHLEEENPSSGLWKKQSALFDSSCSWLFLIPFEAPSDGSPALAWKIKPRGSFSPSEQRPFVRRRGRWISGNYAEQFQELKGRIEKGLIYEANLCGFFELPKIPFEELRLLGTSHFFAHIPEILTSYSPESFVSLSRDQERGGLRVTMEPMKGTLSRKRWSEQEAKEKFLSDQKLLQELRLITDMARNDLARVSVPGSLETRSFKLRSTPYAWQAVSETKGTLKAKTLSFILDLLPAASISGAPKVSALKFITEVEKPRGFYTGILLHVHPQFLKSSVLIRTLFSHNQSGDYLGVGGGVIWESNCEEEWEEILLKTSFLMESE